MISWFKSKTQMAPVAPAESLKTVDLSRYTEISDPLFFEAFSSLPSNSSERDVGAEVAVFTASVFSSVFQYCTWGKRTGKIGEQIADKVINHYLQNYYFVSEPSEHAKLFWVRNRPYVRIIVGLYFGRMDGREVSRELCKLLHQNAVGTPCDDDLEILVERVHASIKDAERLAAETLSSLKAA